MKHNFEKDLKKILEEAVKQKIFKMPQGILDVVERMTSISKKCPNFKQLNETEKKRYVSAIIRTSFLIELTDPSSSTDSTKFQVRWCNLSSSENDIRYASFEECLKICVKIIGKISSLSSAKFAVLRDYCEYSLFEYELPIDYICRNAIPFHSCDNMDLFIDKKTKQNVEIRKIMINPEFNPNVDVFNNIYAKKIKVKAYQTDRAQTGSHKTNREKRWESHPQNFQFAFRRNCHDVETILILQVCMFKNASPELVSVLKKHGYIQNNYQFYRCPITGDELDYASFEQEINDPKHGKSKFQVGHLTPLKTKGLHIAKNVGWVSDDGNRIQGNLSLLEVDNLLKRIYHNRPELKKD